jgi:hypothetical protein
MRRRGRKKCAGLSKPSPLVFAASRQGKRVLSQDNLIWEEVSHSYTEAAVEGDVVVGKRKSPKGEYIKRTPTPMRAAVVVTREEPRSRNKLLPADLS